MVTVWTTFAQVSDLIYHHSDERRHTDGTTSPLTTNQATLLLSKRKWSISEADPFCRSQLANKQRHPFRRKSRQLLASARFSAASLIVLAVIKSIAETVFKVRKRTGTRNRNRHRRKQPLTDYSCTSSVIQRDYKFPEIWEFLVYAQRSSPQALFATPILLESRG